MACLERLNSSAIRNDRGSTLVVVAIVGVIMASIAGVGMAGLMQNGYNTVRFRIHATSDALINSLTTYAGLAPTYRQSLQQNPELQDCVLGTTGTPCVALDATGAAKEHPIVLFFPQPNAAGGHDILAGAKPVGPTGTPSRYNFYGSLCPSDSTDAHCAFQVYATFIATCADPAQMTCNRADKISLHFVIGQPPVNGLIDSLFNAFAHPIDLFAPSISVATILPPLVDSANGNAVVQGMSTAPPTAQQNKILKILQADGSMRSDVNNAILSTGITDPYILQLFADLAGNDWQTAYNVATAMASAGITNMLVADNLIWVQMTDATLMKGIENAVNLSGANSDGLVGAMAQMQITDVQQATALVAAISATGFTNDDLIYNLAISGITDVQQMQKIGDALSSGTSNLLDGWQDETVQALIGAGVTDPMIAQAFDYSWITSPKEVQQFVNVITTANITNLDVATTVIDANITNAATAAKLSATLLALGLDGSGENDLAYSYALADARVTDLTQATTLLAAMKASGVTDGDILAQAIIDGAKTPDQFIAAVPPPPPDDGGTPDIAPSAPSTDPNGNGNGSPDVSGSGPPTALQGLQTCQDCAMSL